jgi:hypothetical protein
MPMPDLSSATWSETDASNNAPPPNGWPEGQSPSSVNDCARMMMGATKRFWDRLNATVVSSGVANSFLVNYAVPPAAYVAGERFSFKAHQANTGAASFTVNGLPGKSILKPGPSGPTPLAGGEIQAGQIVDLAYDGAQFVMMSPGASTITSVTAAVNGGIAVTNGSSAPAVALNVASLPLAAPTQLATIAFESGAGTLKATWAGTATSLVTAAQASKVQMQSASDGTTIVTPARVIDHRGTAKAWVVFSAAGGVIVVRAAWNIVSVGRSGAGDYLVNFATPFASANYQWSITAGRGAAAPSTPVFAVGPLVSDPSPSQFRFGVFSTGFTPTDAEWVSVILWGDQ